VPAVGLWIAGMLLHYYPMLLSGLARMPGEWNDTRLNNYFLEHGWRWLRRLPTDARFWELPAFYPVPNTAAYSDVLLTLAPPYWLFRAAGAPPDATYQLWLLVMTSLNYAVCYLLLRRTVRVGAAAASLGAFLFAFGASRGAQVMHPQLVPQFYTLAALHALWRLFESEGGSADGGDPRPSRWIAVFFLSVAAQLWAGFYLAWFLGFTLLLAALWALLVPAYRAALLGVVRRRAVAIGLSAAAAAALAWPMAIHYLRAVSRVGMMLLVPAALGVALAAERLSARPALVALLAAVVAAEQGQTMMSYVRPGSRA
jgi:hypothetical protein